MFISSASIGAKMALRVFMIISLKNISIVLLVSRVLSYIEKMLLNVTE